MNLEFFVRDLRLTRKGFQPVVGQTSGQYTFSIAFDAQWDGLVKVVVFKNGDETAQLVYTGQTWLPANVCRRGNLYVACHGYRQLGDQVAVLRTVTMAQPVRILGSSPMAGGDPAVYTPSVFETVMGAASAAEKARKELLAAAEAGAFRGAQGEKGDKGDKGDRGDPGPMGETGPQGIRGETGGSGLPAAADLPGGAVSLTLAANTEYRCADAVTALNVTGFASGETGKAWLYAIAFRTGDGITVTLPDTVKWMATPTFAAGKRYYLSFIPVGEQYLGVWGEMDG